MPPSNTIARTSAVKSGSYTTDFIAPNLFIYVVNNWLVIFNIMRESWNLRSLAVAYCYYADVWNVLCR